MICRNLGNNIQQMKANTRIQTLFYLHNVGKNHQNLTIFLRETHKGGKNYKEKQRSDHCKIRLVMI